MRISKRKRKKFKKNLINNINKHSMKIEKLKKSNNIIITKQDFLIILST